MPSFFIDRPIFAWVVALFICLIGAISIPLLAVAQYPIIAPPSISISTSYPGASPENLYNSVTRLIEEELNGASGILNFESTSDSLGQVEITANFVPGTDTGTSSPMTPMINATAPTSRINLFKFICWVCPLGPVRNHVETRAGWAVRQLMCCSCSVWWLWPERSWTLW